MPTVKDLRLMAQNLAVAGYGRLRKPDLIHAIQSAEGNSPCYQQIPDCGQEDCLFREDCLPQVAS